ncbi:MAG: hypothetical protein ACLUPV_02495 [Bilophila wadsworthia]
MDGRLIFGADYVPTLRGTLALKHLSLPRWFGFARDLPPGVQVALDNISGTLPFELTPQKLVASSVTATTLNTVFTGGGGVNDFSNPVIALHLATKDAPLNRIFPEVENKAVSAPSYKVPPLLGGDDSNTAVGYDIHLEAARATFWKWAATAFPSVSPDPASRTEQTKSPSAAAHCTADRHKAISSRRRVALNLTASGVGTSTACSAL